MPAAGRGSLIIARHVATISGLVICVVTFAFHLVGEAVRDVLDPRSWPTSCERALDVPDVPGVLAAGDVAVALTDGPTLQRCQHAMFMGKVAGHNAVASMLGAPVVPRGSFPYVIRFGHGS
jgi:hypothetical protein